MQVSRMYNDNEGISHFEEVALEITIPAGAEHADTARFHAPAFFMRTFADHIVWPHHTVPSRQLVVVVQGSMEMETSDGDVRILHPGDILFAEDLQGPGHATRTESKVVTLHVYMPEGFDLSHLIDPAANN